MFKCSKCSVYVEDINRDLWMCLECLGEVDVSLHALEVITECVETFKSSGLYNGDGSLFASKEEVEFIFTVLHNRLLALGSHYRKEKPENDGTQHGHESKSTGEAKSEEIPSAIGNC